LKFGELLDRQEEVGGHISFGLEDEVVGIRKGGRYI
jgi:hypothetical protein